MSTITGKDIQAMVTHWLQTPAEGYLGSSYGQSAKNLLQNPQNSGNAESFIKKLKSDIPLLASLPDSSISLYGVNNSVDKLDIILQIANIEFDVSRLLNVN